MKPISLLITTLLVTGCCTKEMCLIPSEQTRTELKDFKDDDLDELKLYLVDDEATVLDSLDYFGRQSITLSNDMFHNSGYELKSRSVIIRTAVSSDTLHDFQYDLEYRKVSCNNCPWRKDEEQKMISNFRFEHEGRMYHTNDTLVIRP